MSAGLYYENNLFINKPLKIKSIKPLASVIDMGGIGNGFIVKSDGVEISGFIIQNSGFSYTEEMAGINISKSKGCIIKNNILKNNAFGIYLGESQSCLIDSNKVYGTHKSESLSGNGIHIWNGQNMILENNEVQGNRDGIYFEFVKNSVIKKNKSIANIRYGLHFMYSPNNEYRENLFDRNDCGVAVMYSRGVQMIRNRFKNSHGPASYGILLKDISDSQVVANIFYNNTIGIFLDNTTRVAFEGNLFQNNGWALRVLGNTDSNKFYRNDFVANTYDIATNATSNQNEFSENYWSYYEGLDLNKDGIGDDVYRPVRLSSMLMEQYQISILLMNSLFFRMIDQIENILPVLTPEAFKDLRPRMKRVTEQGLPQ